MPRPPWPPWRQPASTPGCAPPWRNQPKRRCGRADWRGHLALPRRHRWEAIITERQNHCIALQGSRDALHNLAPRQCYARDSRHGLDHASSRDSGLGPAALSCLIKIAIKVAIEVTMKQASSAAFLAHFKGRSALCDSLSKAVRLASPFVQAALGRAATWGDLRLSHQHGC
jgi:hypothetical protein